MNTGDSVKSLACGLCQVRAADPSFHGASYGSWPSWPLSYSSEWLPCLHSLVTLDKQNTLAHLCNFQERFLNIEMFVNFPSPTCFNGVLGFGNQSPSWVIFGQYLGLQFYPLQKEAGLELDI